MTTTTTRTAAAPVDLDDAHERQAVYAAECAAAERTAVVDELEVWTEAQLADDEARFDRAQARADLSAMIRGGW